MIYADNSATTKVKPEVLEKMLPYLTEQYGNPSSLYAFAYDSKRAVENAREEVAKVLGAKSREIFFTSCGSESDNWVLKGVAAKFGKKKTYLVLFTVVLMMFAGALTVQAADFAIRQTKVTVNVGDTIDLDVTGTDKSPRWTSWNENMVKVNQDGEVTSVRKGRTTVSARIGLSYKKCTIRSSTYIRYFVYSFWNFYYRFIFNISV